MTIHDIIEPKIIATKPAKLPIITERNRIDNNIIFDNGQTADDCLALMRVVK